MPSTEKELSTLRINTVENEELYQQMVAAGQVVNDELYFVGGTITSGVSSVDGQTGAVTTNAVKYTSQNLTNTQKAQARTNIGAGTSSFDGDYNSLTNQPDIPSKTSDLTNDSGYITAASAPVQSVNNKTGSVSLGASDVGAVPTIRTVNGKALSSNITLSASDVGALPSSTSIPSKTSDLTNDSGYITSAQAPVQSVNSKTGAVTLTQDDVGNGTTYVRTHNDFTDALKTQIATNKDDISALETTVAGKQATITGAATTITGSNLTASRVLVSDTNGKVAVSVVTSTELGYLDGVTSNIQTQLGNKQDTITGGATTIVSSNLTTNRAVVSNASGKVAVSSVTSTELGYLSGVTSNIQTQLNKKLESAPVTSVNSKTGAVQLTASDVGALSSDTTIPTVNDATLTIQRNSTSVGTFTANASTNKTINIDVPTSKSDIGLGNVDNVKQYSASNPPPYPVTSVNGQTGAVTVGGVDIQLSTTQPTGQSSGDYWYHVTGTANL